MIHADLSPLANHLWQSTLCVLAAWALTLGMKKNRAAIRYGVWTAASVKFLIPFSLLVGAGNQLGWPTAPVMPGRQVPVVIHEIGGPFVSSALRPRATAAPPAGEFPEFVLFGVWLGGFAIGAVHWLRWWGSIRVARHSATPLRVGSGVPVMSSATRIEPGVFGIWRPVLLLPEGIQERLTPAQLEAVLAHELCHVHRRDNLTGAIHMLVETVFWFHPLVWWIRTRLIAERERACDEAVVAAGCDAQVYAEAILRVCKFYLESPLVAMAGVTGSNLKRRIEEIMARRTARNLDAGRKLLLAAAGLAAVAAPVVVGMMDSAPVRAQSQADPERAFAVASIKQNKSEDYRNSGLQFRPGGRFAAKNVPLDMVIASAYDLPPFQSDRLAGGPEWVREDRYDIEAVAEEGVIPAGATGKVRDDTMRAMLRRLLAERFRITVRRDVQQRPVYAVVARKGGPKLQKSARSEADCGNSPTGLGFSDSCHSFGGGMGRGLHAQAVTIADLALAVSNWSDRPVVDETGLDGLYNIQTDGWLPMHPRPPHAPGQEPSAEDRAIADPARPTLFQIFDKLGLKLEPQRAPVETIVILSIDRPSEN
ncbi:MAG: M56 family metallopeptidase [Bryobacteraceae bacterium]|jgi:bla regulator protein blaR1